MIIAFASGPELDKKQPMKDFLFTGYRLPGDTVRAHWHLYVRMCNVGMVGVIFGFFFSFAPPNRERGSFLLSPSLFKFSQEFYPGRWNRVTDICSSQASFFSFFKILCVIAKLPPLFKNEDPL